MITHDKVSVDLGDRSYDILIGQQLLSNMQACIPIELKGRSVFILTDENVSRPHAGIVYESTKASGASNVQMLALPAGEQTKCFSALEKVMSWMLDHGLNRQSVLFAVGGGVIGDLGGFAASMAMRGIPFVQVPTTLLAQVDSSVGGKTAIDMPQGKNLVGSFYQPVAVVCDIDTLDTLPDRQMKAGYAEVAKYGLINDPEFFIWLEKDSQRIFDREAEAITKAVATSCRKKAEIVAQDEHEKGIRALLNLGHTFGHAFEAAFGYDDRLLHGEAISVGMVIAFQLSQRMGLCAETDTFRVKSHFRSVGLPVDMASINLPAETSIDDLVAIMAKDKKVYKGALTFILTHGIGKAFTSRDVAHEDIISVLKQSLERT